jgi:hypothetical protein
LGLFPQAQVSQNAPDDRLVLDRRDYPPCASAVGAEERVNLLASLLSSGQAPIFRRNRAQFRRAVMAAADSDVPWEQTERSSALLLQAVPAPLPQQQPGPHFPRVEIPNHS